MKKIWLVWIFLLNLTPNISNGTFTLTGMNKVFAQLGVNEFICEDEYGDFFDSSLPCDELPCVSTCQTCGEQGICEDDHICPDVECETCGEFYPAGDFHVCTPIRCSLCDQDYYPVIGHYCSGGNEGSGGNESGNEGDNSSGNGQGYTPVVPPYTPPSIPVNPPTPTPIPTITPVQNINIMDISKFAGYYEKSNCLDLAKQILKNYGLDECGNRTECYLLESLTINGDEKTLEKYQNGNLTTQENYNLATECINYHLENGTPIIVGVTHSSTNIYNEGTTDHFVVITGGGYDFQKGQYYYSYMDPGTSVANIGCNSENNRFYYDSENFLYTDPSDYNGKPSTISQVRPNLNLGNWNNTVSYEPLN